MPNGTVIMFNDITGTGRIIGDDGVTVKVTQRSLSSDDGYKILDEGQRVRYNTEKVKSGLEARDIDIDDDDDDDIDTEYF